MKRNRTVWLAVALFAVAGVACSSGQPGPNLRVLKSADLEGVITSEEAQDAALGEFPGGFVTATFLEMTDDSENEPPAWEVVVFNPADNTLMEVEVDAYTGEVLEIEAADND